MKVGDFEALIMRNKENKLLKENQTDGPPNMKPVFLVGYK